MDTSKEERESGVVLIPTEEEVRRLSSAAETSSAEEEESETSEVESWRDKYLALRAEFENFRKRKERQMVEAREMASSRVITALLPTVDGFDRALSWDGPADEAWREGIELIARKLAELLRAEGLEEVFPEKGAIYDPLEHEAVARQEAGEISDGCIASVEEKGYRLKGRLIRPAKVVVAVALDEDGTEPAPAED